MSFDVLIKKKRVVNFMFDQMIVIKEFIDQTNERRKKSIKHK